MLESAHQMIMNLGTQRSTDPPTFLAFSQPLPDISIHGFPAGAINFAPSSGAAFRRD